MRKLQRVALCACLVVACLTGVASASPVASTNHYLFGYDTWYAAQKRPVPWSGNPDTWLSQARAHGLAVGWAPRAGAIFVTSTGWHGHVAYVERVNRDGSYVVSEMSFARFGIVDYRTISLGPVPLVGFIY